MAAKKKRILRIAPARRNPADIEGWIVNTMPTEQHGTAHGIKLVMRPYEMEDQDYLCIRQVKLRTAEHMEKKNRSLAALTYSVGLRLIDAINDKLEGGMTDALAFRGAFKEVTGEEVPEVDASADAMLKRKQLEKRLLKMKIRINPAWSPGYMQQVINNPALRYVPEDEWTQQQLRGLSDIEMTRAQDLERQQRERERRAAEEQDEQPSRKVRTGPAKEAPPAGKKLSRNERRKQRAAAEAAVEAKKAATKTRERDEDFDEDDFDEDDDEPTGPRLTPAGREKIADVAASLK